MKRILFDYTQTYANDINTGIQRVVNKLISNTKSEGSQNGIMVLPVCGGFGHYFNVSDKSIKALTDLSQRVRAFYKSLTSFIKDRPILFAVAKIIFPHCVRIVLINFYNYIYTIYCFRKLKLRRVEFQKGDILVLAEAGWERPNWKAVRRARASGAVVVQVIHDLIPLRHPEFVHRDSHVKFSKWVRKTLKYTDLYICNSEHTKKDLQRYFSSIVNKQTEAECFKLGCDIREKADVEAAPSDIRALFPNTEGKAGYICIGTIEKRKNQQFLLDAFDIVWKQCPQAKLFLVGRYGDSSPMLKKRIEEHPLYGKSLIRLEGLDDQSLFVLLKHSKALVIPTLAEGFGLPIVESLSQGVPVFANDLPVLREVGGEFCCFYNSDAPFSLAKLILDIELHDKWPPVRDIKEFRKVTWRDSARQFLDIISRHFG